MADEARKNLVTKDMTMFKIRMYTPIPPNVVLVGHNVFTKKPKIYESALFHMPWFRSKFVTLENHNRDLAKKKFELGGSDDGLEIVSDIAVTYCVKPIDKENAPMGFKERWMSVLSGFSKGKVSTIAKAILTGVGTVGAGLLLGPIGWIGVPALAAGYVSIFHQDEAWVKEQGAYKAVYQSKAAMAELEQTIYDELRAYYATHSYDQIKGMKIDFSNPEFRSLKDKMDAFADQYGIEATKITVKTADLTDESNQILQRKKEAEMRATEIERQAQAQAAVHGRYREYAQELMAMGFTPEQVAQLLQVEAAKSLGSNAIVNVGGSSPQPMFTVPLNFGQQSGPQEQQAQQSSPTGEEVDPDQNTQGGRRR